MSTYIPHHPTDRRRHTHNHTQSPIPRFKPQYRNLRPPEYESLKASTPSSLLGFQESISRIPRSLIIPKKQWNFAPSTSTPNPAQTEKTYLVKMFLPSTMRKKPSRWKPSRSVRLIPTLRDGKLLVISHSISNRVCVGGCSNWLKTNTRVLET